jgi:hypothetical protein
MGIGKDGHSRNPEVPEIVKPEDAKRLAEARPGPLNDSSGRAGVPKSHKFDLNFVDRRGYAWQGAFKCHIPNGREKVQIGLVRSRLANHTPPDALDMSTLALLEMVSYLTVCLDEKPGWAKDLLELHDSLVVQAIYEEVSAHAARFWGADSGGAGASDDVGSGRSA